MFLLPALLFLGMPFQTALATHKIATVGLGLGASSRHIREKLFDIKFGSFLFLTGVPGVAIGALVATYIPEEVARISLGVLVLSLALMARYLTNPKTDNDSASFTNLRWVIGGLMTFLIGGLNGALSSGTGLFFTFWLVFWFKKPFTLALSYTMIICSLIYNLIGAVILGLVVTVNWSFVAALILGAIIGGYAGSSLSLKREKALFGKYLRSLASLLGRRYFIVACANFETLRALVT